MKWIERDTMSLSAPYRVYGDVQGCSAWIYSKSQQCCLGRQMTRQKAKSICEAHAAKAKEPA